MQTEELSFQTQDGLKIYSKHWPVESPKAVICLVHGLFEHCNRYEHYAQAFNENGFAVIGYDRRGHGYSEGQRGHTPDYEAYLKEVDNLLDAARNRYEKVPLVLYGHSQGGNIVLNYIIDRKPDIKLAITTGSWIVLGTNPNPILLMLLKAFNVIIPGFKAPNDLDPNMISSIPNEVKKYVEDELVHTRFTFRTGYEMLKAAEKLLNYKGEVPIPLLIMHGEKDKIISPESSIGFKERASGDIELKIWPGQFHEVHNDVASKEMFEYIISWLNKKL